MGTIPNMSRKANTVAGLNCQRREHQTRKLGHQRAQRTQWENEKAFNAKTQSRVNLLVSDRRDALPYAKEIRVDTTVRIGYTQ